MSNADKQRVINDLKLKVPNTRLLYVTPEQAATQTFKVWTTDVPAIDTIYFRDHQCEKSMTFPNKTALLTRTS